MRKTQSPIQSSLQSLVILGLLLALPISLVLRAEPVKRTYPDLTKLSEEDLIGLLRLEKWIYNGAPDSWDFQRPYILTDRDFSRIEEGDFQRWPPPNAIQKELVRRGADAIPFLLKHLDDPRKTRAEFHIGNGWISNYVYYSFNFYEARNLSSQWNEDTSAPKTTKYLVDKTPEIIPLAVGDFCISILGQIVNRNLGPEFGFHRSGCLESPVLIPELAATIRKEWSGLTREEHKQSLIQDCYYYPEFVSPIRALKRLLVYYPDDGKRMLLEWFFRKEVDENLITNFLQNQKSNNYDKTKLDEFIKNFKKTEGKESLKYIAYWLKFVDGDSDDYYEKLPNNSLQYTILKKIYKGFNKYSPDYFWHDEKLNIILFDMKDAFVLYSLKNSLIDKIMDDMNNNKIFREMSAEELRVMDKTIEILPKLVLEPDFSAYLLKDYKVNSLWLDELSKRNARPLLRAYLLNRIDLARKAPASPATKSTLERLQKYLVEVGP